MISFVLLRGFVDKVIGLIYIVIDFIVYLLWIEILVVWNGILCV